MPPTKPKKNTPTAEPVATKISASRSSTPTTDPNTQKVVQLGGAAPTTPTSVGTGRGAVTGGAGCAACPGHPG
jgi:hypothetical protein